MTVHNPNFERDATPVDPELLDDLELLWNRNRVGHMGHWEYMVPEGLDLWASFIENHPEYYLPAEEMSVIQTAVSEGIGDHIKGPVSVISLGPGSLVTKDIALAECFDTRTFDMVDNSDEILGVASKTVAEKKPGWEQATHQNNFYKSLPETEFQPVIIMCGQTLFNVEGPSHKFPKAQVVNRLKALRRSGATLIMPQDATDDEIKIRTAYQGQRKFALNVLEHAGQKGDMEFDVRWHRDTRCLAHLYTSRAQGEHWHFNSSWKPTRELFAEAAQEAGYSRSKIYGHNGMTLPIFDPA